MHICDKQQACCNEVWNVGNYKSIMGYAKTTIIIMVFEGALSDVNIYATTRGNENNIKIMYVSTHMCQPGRSIVPSQSSQDF